MATASSSTTRDADQSSDSPNHSREEIRRYQNTTAATMSLRYGGSKTVPRSTAAPVRAGGSVDSATFCVNSRERGPPPVVREKLGGPDTAEKSIYDREPEHYYENVEKDATGRLLNRDTRAFCTSDNNGDKFASARSSSGEDVSSALTSSSRRNNNNVVDVEQDLSSPSTATTAIQRSSRSVNDIFGDEKAAATERSIDTAASSSGTGYTAQLPYCTGRSVFYERLDRDEGKLLLSHLSLD